MKVVFTAEVDLIFIDADHLPYEEDREKAFKDLEDGLVRYLRTPQLDVRAKITRVRSDDDPDAGRVNVVDTWRQ